MHDAQRAGVLEAAREPLERRFVRRAAAVADAEVLVAGVDARLVAQALDALTPVLGAAQVAVDAVAVAFGVERRKQRRPVRALPDADVERRLRGVDPLDELL